MPPRVSTGGADPEGLPTTYRFEYGTSSAYGSSWPGIQVFAGSGSTAQGMAVTVPNLQPGTTYHYRLAASNEDGTSYGADATFTTPGYPVSVVHEAPVLTANLGFINPEAPVVSKSKTVGGRALNHAGKLAKALKACSKDRVKTKRAGCEKQAKAKYGASKKARK